MSLLQSTFILKYLKKLSLLQSRSCINLKLNRIAVDFNTRSIFFQNSRFCEIHTSHNSFTKMAFAKDKAKYLNMSLDEKRKYYRCGSKFVTLENISTWKDYSAKLKSLSSSTEYPKNDQLNTKVSIFVGDITALEIDSIVNAANQTLRGGGGVDGAIHRAAGQELLTECITLDGCSTGQAKITGGYKLPAKYVIHTVGPIGEKPDLLESCYLNSLKIAAENGLRSIAFPCISTGVYHYPNENAAHVALKTTREFMDKNDLAFDRVIFCLFLDVDVQIYESLMQKYFPL